MTASDWFNVATFGIGLVLIFVAGFFAGLHWERGEYVRRVMTGAEPPPWEPTDEELRREFPGYWEGYVEWDRPIPVRRGPYDWFNE